MRLPSGSFIICSWSAENKEGLSVDLKAFQGFFLSIFYQWTTKHFDIFGCWHSISKLRKISESNIVPAPVLRHGKPLSSSSKLGTTRPISFVSFFCSRSLLHTVWYPLSENYCVIYLSVFFFAFFKLKHSCFRMLC